MEADTEVYRETLGQGTRDQSKRRRSDNMSNEIKTIMEIPTKADDLS